MRLKKYNDGKILAPLKCGTRFLDETFGGDDGDIGISDLFKFLFLPKQMEAIIIRPPYEHLISALHTEILGLYNREVEPSFNDIETIVKSFMIKNHNLESATHWSGHLYKHLYLIWKRNKNKIKIVQLKDLSDYLKSINTPISKYDPENYNFNHYGYWCSKDDIAVFVELNFPKEWEDFMKQIEYSNKYYNYLIGEVVDDVKLL